MNTKEYNSLLHHNTELPSDIINLITDLTGCECAKQSEKILPRFEIKDILCNNCKNKTTISNDSNYTIYCNVCLNRIKIKRIKCDLCHNCLFPKKRMFICYRCNNTIIRFKII